MKKAKFALTAVAVFAVIGGALAFKANRNLKPFYKYTTSNINGNVTGICDEKQAVQLNLTVTAVGGAVTTVSVTTAQNVTTCTARVVSNL
ncbi:hypothetical protein [Chitinophaga arvensicola]|uniref:Uncharacterized protein n=1 Tax=Chitinophaga arvensicola TaxID=29529 RepID=A0A1I0SB63_9BACT|nr:hypothetical protein [Chitinophaga arvensicola]SEW53924.1 hypothetical protein SAMN04488122_5764 [Chitinophaga arvensicola]